uniref:STEAP3 metalloreductase n=1 Tax=Ursus maritimus TaxID=29073 RepID=A0A452UBA5_URSMA
SHSAVGILGSGDFARSLVTRLLGSGFSVVVGSRNPKRTAGLFPSGAQVTFQAEAVDSPDVIFVAMFREHYSSLCGLSDQLAGKILVDVSNPTEQEHLRHCESNAEYLASLFPTCTVVKAFNVISAWTLQSGPRDGNRQVALRTGAGPRGTWWECSHHGVSPGLKHPVARTLGHQPLPPCSWHLLHPPQVLANKSHLWIEEEVWRMEIYLSLGVLALGTLSLLAVTSLPSIANSLNWKEFSFVQSTLGFVALLLSTLHTLTYGWTRAFEDSHYKFYLPPTFTLTLLVPCVVILAKGLFLLPCFSRRLSRIRRGWEKDGGGKFTLPMDHALAQKTSHV